MKSLIFLSTVLALVGCKETKKAENPSSKENTKTEFVQTDYAKTGMEYAKATQKELGANLVAAIQKDGTVGALEFCNVQAIPLTDSMAVAHNAKIKRVSDRPRNPNNLANAEELGHIKSFKKAMVSGNKVAPIVNSDEDAVDFYYPITTNAMCLQCHGKPEEQVQPATMLKLRQLYPDDQAVGYGENEVRGIWAIHFKKD